MERNLLNERFITIEKLADGELSHKLPGLTVKFSFAETFLGEVLVASTPQGVCYMAFVVRGRDMAESEMMNRFPGVFWYGTASAIHYITMCVFSLALFYYTDERKKNLLLCVLFMLLIHTGLSIRINLM